MPLNDEPGKFGRISVKIEEVDESWALKLLNESEQEDYWITVQDEDSCTLFKQKELSLISECLQLTTKYSVQDKSFIHVNNDAQDHKAHSLSAIEYQLLERERKNQDTRNKKMQDLKKTKLSFSRIKAFFVA